MKKGEKIKLFSYGTLQDPEVQKQLFDCELLPISATIKGYKVEYNLKIEGVIYPRLSSDPNGTVTGSMYELNTEQLKIADAYETNAYHRASIKTNDGIVVQVYLKKE